MPFFGPSASSRRNWCHTHPLHQRPSVSALCSGFPMPSWYSTTVPCRDLHLTTSRSSCSRLRSAATSTLIVPATWRRTWETVHFQLQLPVLGTLPSFVGDEQSLAVFRQQLKTVLFRTSFDKDANTSAASLLTRDCLMFVRWPCNVLCVIMPP